MNYTQFLSGWFLEDLDLCDRLIDLFENASDKNEGAIGPNRKVDKTIKDSIDVTINPRDPYHLIQDYLKNLSNICDRYKEEWIYCDKKHAPWSLNEDFNIQKYSPGQAFHGWHFERTGPFDRVGLRHLVFMTYLNDIVDGGETEWFYQKIKVRPQKGLSIIWPAEWTFLHRGLPAPKETKYIVTGWYSYNLDDIKNDT